MHMLSDYNREEFLATPQLIRFDYAQGYEEHEPTLLIKGSTLLLKYIVLGARMQLAFARLEKHLLYALKVYDDDEKPCQLWSILERPEEKAALAALIRGEPCQAFLFNELAVNVAWAPLLTSVERRLTDIVTGAATGEVDHTLIGDRASSLLNRIHDGRTSDEIVIVDVPGTTDWRPIRNHFITSHATSSLIDFSENEGGQQEQLAVWLTDNLHPLGVHHAPQIPKGDGFRELTDILISHEFGSMLVESKSLAIFARRNLPNRARLANDIGAKITEAVGQLRGGIRKLKAGVPVLSKTGAPLEVERTKPMHAIVLIPDLDLVQDREAYNLAFIRDFMEATGGFLHLLDVAELLRIVQAAEMIAARGKTTTPMMAFDYYLMRRVQHTVKAGTLCVEVLLRFADEQNDTAPTLSEVEPT